MKIFKILTLGAMLALAACASQPDPNHIPRPAPPKVATLTFQNGQTATIKLNGKHPALENAFRQWVAQGTYTEIPVYRQLPGIFILTGKPRLAGQGFITGEIPASESSLKSVGYGQIGLVTHMDGTVGPEIILMYGQGVVNCCDEPANISIGRITDGKWSLRNVQRGDNLTGIAIQP